MRVAMPWTVAPGGGSLPFPTVPNRRGGNNNPTNMKLKLTPIQRELLLDRLDLHDCIIEVLFQTHMSNTLTREQIADMSDEEWDLRADNFQQRLDPKILKLDAWIRAMEIPQEELDDDMKDVLADVCDGSTFFARERDDRELHSSLRAQFGGHSPAWWDRRHRAADQLDALLTAVCGRRITFARE